MKGNLTDPRTWSDAIGDLIQRIGWSEFMNLVFIVILGYVAYTVPTSVNNLNRSIQQNTDHNDSEAIQSATRQTVISATLQQMGDQHVQIVATQKETTDVLDKVVSTLVQNQIVGPKAEAYDAQDRSDLWKRVGQLQRENAALKQKLGK